MNQNYYTDAMSNYLIIRCPADAAEGYQYRMLAVNRIRGLLPCSLRSIDGQTYLYYEITSRQNLAVKFDRRMISGQEMKKILYSITEMSKSLSDYLLDDRHLFMDPEYIFYDYEEEAYWFTYYPEQRDEGSLNRLMEYLADKIDPEAAESTAVVYRLCDLSSNQGFSLREELLDHEYEQAALKNIPENPGEQNREINPADERNPDRILRHPGERDFRYDPAADEDMTVLSENAEGSCPGEKGTEKGCGEKNEMMPASLRKREHPEGILIAAILFLVLAAGLGAAGYFMSFAGSFLYTARAGMIVCLILSIGLALYGAFQIWRKDRKAQESLRLQREDRQNEMIPSMEYSSKYDMMDRAQKDSPPRRRENGRPFSH